MNSFNSYAKINYSFYSDDDYYSDGDIEDEILELVKNNSDFSSILASDNRWPILYHLSPTRRNLLEWYEFSKESTILEIGAGCGALTGLFCEKIKSVTAVELSKKRAEIIATRYKDCDNLEIIVGNLNNIIFKEKFDYITLIGVLEYAGKFTNSENPFTDFLLKIKSLLNPGGTLIIAIENKFGLKYWAGAREDHYAKFFTGIENYVESNEICTFSNNEMSELLGSVGLEEKLLLYPYPDYKLCTQIFSKDFLPTPSQLSTQTPNYDYNRYAFFNEKLALANVTKCGMFEFFANSFLIFANKGDKIE